MASTILEKVSSLSGAMLCIKAPPNKFSWSWDHLARRSRSYVQIPMNVNSTPHLSVLMFGIGLNKRTPFAILDPNINYGPDPSDAQFRKMDDNLIANDHVE